MVPFCRDFSRKVYLCQENRRLSPLVFCNSTIMLGLKIFHSIFRTYKYQLLNSILTMHFCCRLSFCFSTSLQSSKTGWAAYRLHRRSEHFVGTEPSMAKYHDIPDKKSTQPYGLQGTNHLLPGFGKVASKLPTRTILKKDKVYAWCTCGYSHSQPLCDGTHLTVYTPRWAGKLRPVRYIPEKDMEVWLCNCKQTKNRPFCDGSHKKLLEAENKDLLADE